jgi:D-alanine-D-alanine ligase
MKNVEFDVKVCGRVAVLMGGTSGEREVSLMTGGRVLKALQEAGVDAFGLDVGHDVAEQLTKNKPDRAWIALHGRGGEDGTIQGLLEWMQIPYTGSGVMASSLAMDKMRCKYMWQGMGLPTLPFRILDEKTDLDTVIADLGLPLAVKPSCEGSSLGVKKVMCKEDLLPAFQAAFEYKCPVIAEPYVEFAEYTVGILGKEALPVIKIETPQTVFYDFEAKYFSDETRYLIPSGLDEAAEKELQAIALNAFQSLGCRHWGRVDVVRDKDGQFWILEVNTIPGMTEHSLVPQAAKARGISFAQLALRILAQSLA